MYWYSTGPRSDRVDQKIRVHQFIAEHRRLDVRKQLFQQFWGLWLLAQIFYLYSTTSAAKFAGGAGGGGGELGMLPDKMIPL